MSPPVLAIPRPLAPQPTRSNDAPVLQPLQSHYPLKSTRSRRGTINAACRECRLKKLKCDGMRPSCQRCIVKGIDSCEYTVNPGETRFTALKRKNASLVTESDRMHKFIEALRSASPSQAQEMLNSLRTTADASTQFLSTLAHFDPESQPLHRQESDPSVSSGPSPPSNNDTVSTPPTSRSRSSNSSNTNPSSSFPFDDTPAADAHSPPFADFERPVPSIDVLRKCISTFYNESGKLFHVFSPSHVETQFQILAAAQDDKQARRLATCELCAVGALGSQYTKETLAEGTQQSMYSAAKHLLEDAVTVDTGRAAKICVLLCLFNIMNKQKVAMTFVEMGLNLLTRPPIPQVCPPNMERSQWMELRKTWRVLVFLETWLSSTLGYVSGLQLPKDLMNAKSLEIEDETDLEEKVTTAMIRITIIKFDMLRLSLSFNGLSALMVETITKELRQWHGNLPRDMRLTELANNPEVSFELRRTIYYVNFLYFGAQIMLLRRVLQSLHEKNTLLAGDEAAVSDLIVQAKNAARESAKLFERLYVEGGIVKKCWVCIFQAYSSCVIILHHVAEMLFDQHMEGRSVSTLQDDLHLASACLDFLGVCSEKDVAAGQFHSILSRFYATLYSTASGQLKFGPDVISAARELNELIRRPFKMQGQASIECCYLWQEDDHQHNHGQQRIDDPNIRDGTNAPVQSFCCDDSWQRIDGIKNDGMIHDLLSSIRPGRFLPGFESSAWN
ncbi:hypothetical protein QM012_001379 [Aureobasidium pullulans]|uniref:Zn(2)-C6 fungal-type domain-containing protein n=1 Tax=Aureobasidium pullulans TaxID=5580 RepID=A0ABR0TDX4_AURPU